MRVTRFPAYSEAVRASDWSDFYISYRGEEYFGWLRRPLLAVADVVLIDSPTGVSEIARICTQQMADAIVAFCVPNAQNLHGMAAMARSFGLDAVGSLGWLLVRDCSGREVGDLRLLRLNKLRFHRDPVVRENSISLK